MDGIAIAEQTAATPPLAWQTFMAMNPPKTTHNDLCVRRHSSGHHFIGKSDRLLRAEDAICARIRTAAPKIPMDGKLRAKVTWCFPTNGTHLNGEPMDEVPDLDNLAKTFFDCLKRCRVIEDDALIVEEHLTKVWSDPCGIFVRIERICGAGGGR